LGVLAIKPRSAYELAAEMRHCFEYYWPRDDKRVYADVRTLAEAGLAAADVSYTGRRRRTTYRITPPGRAALRRWLAAPSTPISLEFEALIKVYLARLGSRDDLLSTLEAVQRDAEFMRGVATTVRTVYLEGCAPFQDEYVHTWAFVYDFLTSYFTLVTDWAARTRAVAEGWSDLEPADKREAALALFEAKQVEPPQREPDAPPMPGEWRRHAEARARHSGVEL
jgi:DNA-binding PadR family transcriptional regulator